MLEAARASYQWRTTDAEFAELAYDSALADVALAGSAGFESPRVLTFSAGLQLVIELEVIRSTGVVGLLGHLFPPGRAELELRHGGRTRTVEADELGRFAAERLRRGPFSLRCTRLAADAVTVTTDWTQL
jgi:hypothetical protein